MPAAKVAYRAAATATGGRNGHAATHDGALDVTLTSPKELGGPGGAGVNPEQLFATGYAAYSHTLLVACLLITAGAVLTHQGEVRHAPTRDALAANA